MLDNSVKVIDGTFEVNASVLAPLLGVSASDVPILFREQQVTSVVERGEGEHAGSYRLTFFYGHLRARLIVDGSGNIQQRSAVDFGVNAVPPKRHAGRT